MYLRIKFSDDAHGTRVQGGLTFPSPLILIFFVKYIFYKYGMFLLFKNDVVNTRSVFPVENPYTTDSGLITDTN